MVVVIIRDMQDGMLHFRAQLFSFLKKNSFFWGGFSFLNPKSMGEGVGVAMNL